MNHPLTQAIERTDFRISRRRALALVTLGAGCAGRAPESGDAPAEIGSTKHALQCYDPYYGEAIDDPNCPWQGDYGEVAPTGGATISHALSPAFCFAAGSSFLVVSTDSQQRYRTLAMDFEQNFASAWGVYAQSQGFKFGSRPACSSRGSAGTGIMIAGKVVNNANSNNNNKLFASAGNLATGNTHDPPPNPTGTFAVIDSANAYTSGGMPALASSSNQVVLVTLGNDRSGVPRLFAYTSGINGSNFGSRISGPRLPAGVPLSGTPAIVFQNSTGVFHIIVRSPTNLFETYFNGSVFTNQGGAGGTIALTPLPIGGAFDSDPALTYSTAYDIETLFFRRGSVVMQTSAALWSSPVLGTFPLLPMPALPSGFTFSGTPAAVGLAPGFPGPAFMLGRFDTNGSRLAYTYTTESFPIGP